MSVEYSKAFGVYKLSKRNANELDVELEHRCIKQHRSKPFDIEQIRDQYIVLIWCDVRNLLSIHFQLENNTS